MEFNGVRIDRDKAFEDKKILEDSLAEKEESIRTAIGKNISFSSSSPDLAHYLYEVARLPIKKRTEMQII